MSVTEAAVIEALRPVQDPELHRSIVDLGMVRSTTIDGGHVEVGYESSGVHSLTANGNKYVSRSRVSGVVNDPVDGAICGSID